MHCSWRSSLLSPKTLESFPIASPPRCLLRPKRQSLFSKSCSHSRKHPQFYCQGNWPKVLGKVEFFRGSNSLSNELVAHLWSLGRISQSIVQRLKEHCTWCTKETWMACYNLTQPFHSSSLSQLTKCNCCSLGPSNRIADNVAALPEVDTGLGLIPGTPYDSLSCQE